jgi:putative aldouronate transport system substrate-binding protein
MFRFAGTLFGVRGLESRQDYLYVGNDGAMHDARQEAATYEALGKLHDMVSDAIMAHQEVTGYDGEIFGFDIYRNSDPVLAFCDTDTERKYSNVRECLTEALKATRWRDIEREIDD